MMRAQVVSAPDILRMVVAMVAISMAFVIGHIVGRMSTHGAMSNQAFSIPNSLHPEVGNTPPTFNVSNQSSPHSPEPQPTIELSSRLALHSRPIAFSVVLSPEKLELWGELFRVLRHAPNISFFVHIYGGEPDQAVLSKYEKDVHWAAVHTGPVKFSRGRNLNIQRIYAEEVRRGLQFDWWLIADGDAGHWHCARCPRTASPDFTGYACCMDYFIDTILNPDLRLASLSITLGGPEVDQAKALANDPAVDRSFVFRDCADAIFQAYHRAAAPIVFPYLDEIEEAGGSWWSSQGMMFHLTSGCLAGAGVLPARYFTAGHKEDHISYPRDRDLNLELQTLKNHYPDLFTFPLNEATTPSYLCKSGRFVTLREGNAHPDLIPDWWATNAYRACMKVKEPIFVREVGGGVPQALAPSFFPA